MDQVLAVKIRGVNVIVEKHVLGHGAQLLVTRVADVVPILILIVAEVEAPQILPAPLQTLLALLLTLLTLDLQIRPIPQVAVVRMKQIVVHVVIIMMEVLVVGNVKQAVEGVEIRQPQFQLPRPPCHLQESKDSKFACRVA